MTCLLYWLTGFRGEDFKTFVPLLKLYLLKSTILDGGQGHRTQFCHACFKLAYWFQRRRFLSICAIGSYVKTMSADGRHLGWRSGSLDIILKVDHLRTIHAMFALN